MVTAEPKVLWKPIDTAPRETEILIGRWNDRGVWQFCQSGYYFDAGNDLEGEPSYWYWHCDCDTCGVSEDPQFWMPLPPPPEKPQ